MLPSHQRRYPISCCPFTSSGGQMWYGEALKASWGGVRLFLERRFEPGTVLRLRLRGAAELAGDPALLVVRVIRIVAQASKRWVIDCEFVSDLDEAKWEPVAFIARHRHNPAAVNSAVR